MLYRFRSLHEDVLCGLPHWCPLCCAVDGLWMRQCHSDQALVTEKVKFLANSQ
jgi:hypothetical protein